MKIITVTNQKGGTGKTFITMNLGVALALTVIIGNLTLKEAEKIKS